MVLTHPHLLTIWIYLVSDTCGNVWYQGITGQSYVAFHGIWHHNCGDTSGVFGNHDMELGDRYRSDNCGI